MLVNSLVTKHAISSGTIAGQSGVVRTTKKLGRSVQRLLGSLGIDPLDFSQMIQSYAGRSWHDGSTNIRDHGIQIYVEIVK